MFPTKNKPYLIAEIGGNHEGNIKYAFRLIDLAMKSKVDAIKFQMYTGNGLVNEKLDPTRYAHFNKFSLRKEDWVKIAKFIKKKGFSFSASIWETKMLDYVDKYLDFYKIGSGDMNSYQIIESFAKRAFIVSISPLIKVSDIAQ